ncbi:MAG: FtsX-like permease family protein [Bacteroidota bacterium]
MLRNNLKIFLRTFWKHKLFTIINVLGLAIGMSCCFLILMFVMDEFRYDNFHKKTDRIYRLNYSPNIQNSANQVARIPPPIAPLLLENFPEMEGVARMYLRSATVEIKQEQSSQKFEVEQIFFADSGLSEIFSFSTLIGDVSKALRTPAAVILSRETAIRLYGSVEDAINQILLIKSHYPFQVMAVVEDYPPNSHWHFDMLAPYQNMFEIEGEKIGAILRDNLSRNWIITHSYTYVLLKEGFSPESVNEGFTDFLQAHSHERFRDNQRLQLQALLDIHLDSTVGIAPEPPGNSTYVYLFLHVAFIILLIACINFVNLSTASSLPRAKEIGIRKVLGASRMHIVRQFLFETFLMSFLALIVAICLVEISLPFLNAMINKELSFGSFDQWQLGGGLLLIFILTGLLAGTYPAFFVSRFQPITALKTRMIQQGTKGKFLRKTLIGIQLLTSLGLIAATTIVYRQLQMVKNQPLGFQEEHMLTLPLFSPNFNSVFGGVDGQLRKTMNAFEGEMLKHSRIDAITLSSSLPATGLVHRNFNVEGMAPDERLVVATISVDYDFSETYELELLAGRDFDVSFGTDHEKAFVINETAVKFFGWASIEEAVGKAINMEGRKGYVVGVLRDFHHKSLRSPIDALVLYVSPGNFTTFSLHIHGEEIPGTLAFIEKKWNEFFPSKVFEYQFLEDEIQETYESDQRLGMIISFFALLAILISCVGLYGLVSYTAQQKTKEIGIRKILGAASSHLFYLLTKEYLILILLAWLLAIPVVWWIMDDWLSNYAFHVDISIWLLCLPLVGVLLLTLSTISIQFIRILMIDPAEQLRTE